MPNQPSKPKYRQRSGAQNRKRKAEKDKALKAEQIQNNIESWRYKMMEEQGTTDLLKQLPLSPKEVEAILALPVQGIPPTQTVSAIIAVQQQQRLGNFYLPAQFADSILQDPVIFSSLQTRVKSLVGKDKYFEAADDSDMAQQICDDIEDHFSTMAPESEQEEMLRWGLLLGVSLSQIMWDTRTAPWVPTLKIEHPKNMFWNWATRCFNWTTQSEGQIQILENNIQFDLFQPYTTYLPWTRAMILPLAMPWLSRNMSEQWWDRHQERNGMGILLAITSAEATPAEERLFLQQLYNLGSSSVVRAPQGVDGNKFDIEIKQGSSDLYEGFKQRLDHVDRRIAMVVLGQDKTSMSKEAGVQIGGQDAGENVRIDLMRSDAKALAYNLREKLFKPYIMFNYGAEYVDLAPCVCYDIEPADDLLARAQELNTAQQAINGLLTLPLADQFDFHEIYEQFQIPMLEPGESIPEVVDKIKANEDAKAAEMDIAKAKAGKTKE